MATAINHYCRARWGEAWGAQYYDYFKLGEKLLLVAHLVPGYFATVSTQAHWNPDWNRKQQALLWVAAVGSTFAPDLDVIYNTLFRGFFNHSTLWTHSIFPYLGLVCLWGFLKVLGRWSYLRAIVGLIALGGLSHLVLDVIAHSTPLLYPFSLHMFGAPSLRVLQGGLWAYLTDPIFLLEPLLITLAGGHLLARHFKENSLAKKLMLMGLVSGFAVFTVAFLLLLPILQDFAETMIAN